MYGIEFVPSPPGEHIHSLRLDETYFHSLGGRDKKVDTVCDKRVIVSCTCRHSSSGRAGTIKMPSLILPLTSFHTCPGQTTRYKFEFSGVSLPLNNKFFHDPPAGS